MSPDRTYHLLLKKLDDGTITEQEKWQLDRASLDDPFLADALEGYYNYAVEKPNLTPSHNQKLRAKTIKLWRPLSIAASLAILLGVSFWLMQTQSSSLMPSHQDMAQKENVANEKTIAKQEVLKDAEDQSIEEGKTRTQTVSNKAASDNKSWLNQNRESENTYTESESERSPSASYQEEKSNNLENLPARVEEETESTEIAEYETANAPAANTRITQEKSFRAKKSNLTESEALVLDGVAISNDALASTTSNKSNIIRGYVKDLDGLPIKNAYVITDKDKDTSMTLSDGSYSMDVVDMDQKAKVSYAGYTSEMKSLQPQLDFELSKAQSDFSEPPLLLQETMNQSELKRDYTEILDKTFVNSWNICRNQRSGHKKLQLRIVINESGNLDLIDYITTVNEQCQNEIENLIRRAVFEEKFRGSQKVELYYTLRF